MKNVTYLIITILLCGVLPAYTQSSDSLMNKYSLGIIGGINFADMDFPNNQGSDAQEVTTLPGFASGVVFDIRLSEKFYAHIEPMYLQKGGKIEEGTDPANQPEGQINISSIEIPLLIKYTFGDRIKPYLVVGPTVGYNLKSEIEFDLTGLIFKGDLDEVTESFDFGLTFGGGLQVPFNFGIIFLEGRYTFGLLNQRKSGTVTVSSTIFEFDLTADKEDDKYTTRGFQLLAGALFPL
jgi:hypothetical protein